MHKKTGSSFLGRMSNSFQNLANVYVAKERDPEWDKVNCYFSNLTDKLTALDRISHRVHKERAGKNIESFEISRPK